MTTLIPHLPHPKYRPDIDGLRAVAVLSVVTFHAFPTLMKGGFIGVDVFFVISGFLISTIIFQSLDEGSFSFSEFYARRIKRIFPALVLVLLACLAFGWLVLIPEELNQLGKHIAAGVGFVSNFVFWREAGYFDNSAETKPLLHLWSLGIEEQFYIVWPLLLWLAWKRKFNLLTLAAVVALVSFGLNSKGIGKDPVATFYSPQTRFWELLSGSVLAWFALYKKNDYQDYRLKIDARLARLVYQEGAVEADGRTLSNLLSLSGCLLLFYGFCEISKDLGFPGKWAVIPVLGAVLVILAGPNAWLNRQVLSSKPLVWFGVISFPLYLWHWPLLSFARIIRNETPRLSTRVAAVLASILLAWLTVKFLEKPIRLGSHKVKLKLAALCGSMVAVGIVGVLVSSHDYTATHGFEKLAIKRKGFEHAFGSSMQWYRGKNDWLFLGNAHDNTVAKLKLAIKPDAARLNAAKDIFSQISAAVAGRGTKVVLFVAPNKSTIYPEYLPDELTPSSVRYLSYFVDALKDVPGLTVHDATNDLLAAKQQGILYWKTDTHWNRRGAFVAYAGFSRRLGLPIPDADFEKGQEHSGDLIGISKLKNFPLSADDDWSLVWKENPVWREDEIPNEQRTTFGSAVVVANSKPLSSKHVWVLGDSFTGSLRPYFNATFKEVRYVGHWEQKLGGLAAELSKTDRKPDLIVVVVAERLM